MTARRWDESAAWTALRASLHADSGDHPAEELLVAYVDARSSLAADVVASLERHFVECESCEDEIAVLQAVKIAPVAAPIAAREGEIGSIWRRFVAALSGPVWRPALALTAVLVLMVPTLVLYGRHDVLNEPAKPTFDSTRLMNDSARDVAAPSQLEEADAPQTSVRAAPSEAAPVAAPPPAPVPAKPVQPRHESESTKGIVSPRAAQLDRRSADVVQQFARSGRADEAVAQARGLAVQPPTVALDYLPGGHGSVKLVVGGSIVIRVPLGSESRALELRVATADGRRNRRAIRVASQRDAGATRSPGLAEIPADWLSWGDNLLDVVVAGSDVPVLSPYTLTRDPR